MPLLLFFAQETRSLVKGMIFMKKRYFVSLWTKRKFFHFQTNSIALAKRIAKLPFWKVVKITDWKAKDVIFYKR